MDREYEAGRDRGELPPQKKKRGEKRPRVAKTDDDSHLPDRRHAAESPDPDLPRLIGGVIRKKDTSS